MTLAELVLKANAELTDGEPGADVWLRGAEWARMVKRAGYEAERTKHYVERKPKPGALDALLADPHGKKAKA